MNDGRPNSKAKSAPANASSAAWALEMRGVSKRYPGTLAVDGVDFAVRPGEVHALMGENGAGKSTLMKMLAGAFSDYTGQIFIHGREVRLHSPSAAKKHGVGMVYQELSLARPISIAENLLAGRLPVKQGVLVDRSALLEEARRCLAQVGLEHLDPRMAVDEISQHEAQLVEIAKVLGNHPHILVMDEPTSALSQNEVQRLFEIIRRLKREGLAIVYISHHLPEVFAIADRVTVLRDGRQVDTCPLAEVTAEKLVEKMIGRKVGETVVHREMAPGAVRLQVQGFSRYGFFHRVTFDVRAGEILGIGGLAGAGRSELARSMCGIDPYDEGEIVLDGREWTPRFFAYLTEDRKHEGLALLNSALENMLAALNARRRHLISRREGAGVFGRLAEDLQLAPADPLRQALQFSGGNQQKILLAKWLATAPEVCILDEPTRGVDVGAKQVIHEAIGRLADNGKCVILISSDLPELVTLSDRVVILRKGHLIREMKKGEFSEETVLLAANGEG